MEFRKATESDIDSIMNIINQAQGYFKAQGINQWQNNYPNYETIKTDIDNNNGYVLVQDGKVVGTTAVIFGKDRNYDFIYEGKWRSHSNYAVIHRIAIASNQKGLGLSSIILKDIEKLSLEKGIHSIRVDTHEENLSMQKLLNKNCFQYCGIIYLEDGNKRIAFEKVI